jgi:hypothetical protein
MAGSRPFGVSLITIVIVIWGILGAIAAVFALLNFTDNTGLIGALVMLAVSLVYLLVARGLWHGSGGARLIVAVVTVISLINGIWMLITVDGQQRWSGLGNAAVALIVLVILYSKRASAFFK